MSAEDRSSKGSLYYMNDNPYPQLKMRVTVQVLNVTLTFSWSGVDCAGGLDCPVSTLSML